MTLNKAKKILGKQAENISDKQLEREIEVAQMLAEIVLLKYKEEKSTEQLS